jgi:signal transduction histidine kinase
MITARTRLSASYLTGLRAYLEANGTGPSARARALGRAALSSGLSTPDLALMHAQAVVALTSYDLGNPGNGSIRRAKRTLRRAHVFFGETLGPIESAAVTARRTARDLEQRHDTLQRHSAALARGNRRLQREINRRRAGEVIIREGRQQYQKLFAESQLMQKKLRQMTRQMILAQEEERKEISRELHDEVVQTLVGISVQLATLTKGASVGLHTLKERIARTQRLVTHSVNAVHRFARELRPPVLDDLGLIPALRAYCDGLASRKKFKISLVASGPVESLDSGRRTVLYRVAQEALTNVSRHAKASKVWLTLGEAPGVIRMEIIDNGQSFLVDQALATQNRNRLGLIGMKERLEMVGGTLTITSTPGRGTTVRADIPLHLPPPSA